MAGLYIHVPFCTRRCLYCDFFSNTDMGYRQEYLKALLREMELRREYPGPGKVETVYFGGGTPSQLPVDDLSLIFEGIGLNFDLADSAEITLEANPDDMTEEYVKALRATPVNRISMGIQSFDTDDLLFLHRRHDSAQAIRAVEHCKAENFHNISIDLIYGLPGQTVEKWEANLAEALRLNIPHISAYHLIYEEETALYRLLDEGKVSLPEEETSLALFSTLIDTLGKAGYEHYEISNFARPGFYSRHNSSYWENKKYLGLGPSAHSFNGENREWNISSLPEYIRGIKMGIPALEREELTLNMKYNDYIITRLRTSKGIKTNDLSRLFGDSYQDYCLTAAQPFLTEKLLALKDDRLFLTRKGIFLSDTVMRELIHL